jgi:GAF domain-containing protein
MNPKHSQMREGKQMPTPAQLRAGAIHAIQQATAMREEAAETRLQIWLERLTQQWMHTCRDMALEPSLDAALSVTSADCANIQLVDPSGRGLVLTAQRGFRQPFLDFFAIVDDCQTACGVAWQEHRPVVVEDILCSPIFEQSRVLEVMLEAGIRAVKSTPLLDRTGQILGMLSVHYRRPRAHIDSDLTRFQALAAAVAAGIGGSYSALRIHVATLLGNNIGFLRTAATSSRRAL